MLPNKFPVKITLLGIHPSWEKAWGTPHPLTSTLSIGTAAPLISTSQKERVGRSITLYLVQQGQDRTAAVYAQQTNLSDRLKTPWVSSYKSTLLMSPELRRFLSPEAPVLYLFEKFPKVTLLWLCCQLTEMCFSGDYALSKSVGMYAFFCWE